MLQKIAFALSLSFILFSAYAHAQENEVGIVVGGMFSPDGNISRTTAAGNCITNSNCALFSSVSHINPQVSFEAVYGRRVLEARLASLYVEIPVVGVPAHRLGSNVSSFSGSVTSISQQNFSSIFFTPSLKAKFLPDAPVSPFVSAGGGLAHFKTRSQLVFPGISPDRPAVSTNTGAFQIGGGLDFKTPIPALGFRVEVRDFITGSPGFQFDHHQNLLTGAGVTFHF